MNYETNKAIYENFKKFIDDDYIDQIVAFELMNAYRIGLDMDLDYKTMEALRKCIQYFTVPIDYKGFLQEVHPYQGGDDVQ